MNAALEEAVWIGVGIDTARYGHRATFLKSDRQPAAPPLDVLESAAGYESLRQVLERLVEREPRTRLRVRIDAAGQYATNLEIFLRKLSLPLEISTGEPSRNSAYRKAHYPKSKTDDVDSRAQARYAMIEVPLSERGRLIVSNAVRLDLGGREISGDVDRNLAQAQLLRRLPAGVADDDHAVVVHDDPLSPPKLFQAGCYAHHGIVVDPRVALVRLDLLDWPHLDLHGALLPAAKSLGACT